MFVALIIERTRAEYWARCAASNEILKAPGASVGLSGMVLLRVAFGSCPMLGRTRLRYLEAGGGRAGSPVRDCSAGAAPVVVWCQPREGRSKTRGRT